MDALKAGTRCECRNTGNSGRRFHGHGEYLTDTYARCQHDAVRMVETNVSPSMEMETAGEMHCDLVPMCAACADFHERVIK